MYEPVHELQKLYNILTPKEKLPPKNQKHDDQRDLARKCSQDRVHGHTEPREKMWGEGAL